MFLPLLLWSVYKLLVVDMLLAEFSVMIFVGLVVVNAWLWDTRNTRPRVTEIMDTNEGNIWNIKVMFVFTTKIIISSSRVVLWERWYSYGTSMYNYRRLNLNYRWKRWSVIWHPDFDLEPSSTMRASGEYEVRNYGWNITPHSAPSFRPNVDDVTPFWRKSFLTLCIFELLYLHSEFQGDSST